MAVGGTNFNNNFGDYDVNKLGAKPKNAPAAKPENSGDLDSTKARLSQITQDIETAPLGKVGLEGIGVAGNVVKTENTSKPVETKKTGAAAINELFDDPMVSFGLDTESAGDNSEIFAVSSVLTSAGNGSNARMIDAGEVAKSGNDVFDDSEKLLKAALG